MYAFDDMIDMAIKNLEEEWRSDAHRKVAINLLIGNGRIDTMDQLMEFVSKINAVPSNYIKQFILEDAIEMGIPIN